MSSRKPHVRASTNFWITNRLLRTLHQISNISRTFNHIKVSLKQVLQYGRKLPLLFANVGQNYCLAMATLLKKEIKRLLMCIERELLEIPSTFRPDVAVYLYIPHFQKVALQLGLHALRETKLKRKNSVKLQTTLLSYAILYQYVVVIKVIAFFSRIKKVTTILTNFISSYQNITSP